MHFNYHHFSSKKVKKRYCRQTGKAQSTPSGAPNRTKTANRTFFEKMSKSMNDQYL